MNDPSPANADCHMVHMTISRIEDKVAGSGTRYADLLSDRRLFAGRSGKTDTNLAEYRRLKSGRVGAVCQTGAAIYIWISDKLQSIRGNRRTITTANYGPAAVGTAAAAGRLV